MSLSISVRDFRGCDRATIEVSPIALVAGLNGAGKSSILRAAASAVSGRVLPPGILKKDAAALVRAGMSSGAVTVKGEGGTCRASWPAADAAIDGPQPPSATPIAAGLDSVLSMDDKTRARTLVEYMKADPSRDDLFDALRDADLPADKLAEAWKQVEVHGWDGAAEQYKLDGSAAKREWERLTGEKYGSAKAALWAPPGYSGDLDADTEALAAAVDDARATHEHAVRAEAASGERLVVLAEQSAALPGLELQWAEAQTDADKARSAVHDAETALRSLPDVPKASDTIPCPCCGESVAVQRNGAGYILVKPESLDELEASKRLADIADAQEAVNTSAAALLAATDRVNAIKASLRAAEQAKAEHERLSALAGAATIMTAADAHAALDRAESRLQGAAVKAKADSLHAEITTLAALVKALSPEGVRKRKLAQAVEAFNPAILSPLCDTAGWKPVALTEALGVTYGGRPYTLLSDSEQYRVRVTLQIAMARLDGSALVIIDGADILDPAGRNGLFALLAETGLPALVGMTVASMAKAPDLAAHGLGRTHWIEAGQCRAVGAVED